MGKRELQSGQTGGGTEPKAAPPSSYPLQSSSTGQQQEGETDDPELVQIYQQRSLEAPGVRKSFYDDGTMCPPSIIPAQGFITPIPTEEAPRAQRFAVLAPQPAPQPEPQVSAAPAAPRTRPRYAGKGPIIFAQRHPDRRIRVNSRSFYEACRYRGDHTCELPHPAEPLNHINNSAMFLVDPRGESVETPLNVSHYVNPSEHRPGFQAKVPETMASQLSNDDSVIMQLNGPAIADHEFADDSADRSRQRWGYISHCRQDGYFTDPPHEYDTRCDIPEFRGRLVHTYCGNARPIGVVEIQRPEDYESHARYAQKLKTCGLIAESFQELDEAIISEERIQRYYDIIMRDPALRGRRITDETKIGYTELIQVKCRDNRVLHFEVDRDSMETIPYILIGAHCNSGSQRYKKLYDIVKQHGGIHPSIYDRSCENYPLKAINNRDSLWVLEFSSPASDRSTTDGPAVACSLPAHAEKRIFRLREAEKAILKSMVNHGVRPRIADNSDLRLSWIR